MSAFIVSDGLAGADRYFREAPNATVRASRMALNKVVAGVGRTRLKRAMELQVAFPAGYINSKRLAVGRKATDDDLTASLIARQRPTSLATFDPYLKIGQKGAKVQVRPGSIKNIDRAFPIRLKQGNLLDAENYNLGLAIRLKPGERVLGRKQQFNGDATLTLLYGPSVDQILQDVGIEESEGLLDDVETEFFRTFAHIME